MNFYSGHIPDAAIDPPEEKPVCRCPRCKSDVYAGQDVFVDKETFEVIGCKECMRSWEVEE